MPTLRLVPLSRACLTSQFHLTSLVVMDAFGHAVVVGWLVHEEKTAEALACGFTAWLRAVAGVMPAFKPANFFSDDDPAEHKAIRCGATCWCGPEDGYMSFVCCTRHKHRRLLAGWRLERTCRSISAPGIC